MRGTAVRLVIVFVTAALAAAGAARGAAPVNDRCENAEVLPGGGPFPLLSGVHDSADATSAGDPAPSCQADVSRGVFFRFSPAETGRYTLSLCPEDGTATTLEDTVLAVYDGGAGPCAGLAELPEGCDDDGCAGLQSRIEALELRAGRTYSIVAYSFSTAPPAPGRSTVQLRIEREEPTGAPPPNDTCAGAETIPGGGPFPVLSALTPDVSGATSAGDPAPPTCQPNVSRSVWYRFVPAESGSYEFATCADRGAGTTVDDTVVAVYRAEHGTCGGPLTAVAGGCDDNACANEAKQAVVAAASLVAGETYFVLVHVFGPDLPRAGQRAVQLRVGRNGAAPPNDTCGGAEEIPPAGPFPHLTARVPDVRAATSAGDPLPPPCQVSVSRSVWYRFAPAAAGTYRLTLCADAPTATTADDTVLSVYTSADGTCAGVLEPVPGGCDDDGCGVEPFQSVLQALALEADVTYYVLVHQYGSAPLDAEDAAVQLRVEQIALDGDGDGVPDDSDCAPADASAWGLPGAARDLVLAPDRTSLGWAAPSYPGADEVRYDLLRSGAPADFAAPACVVHDTLETSAADPAAPAPLFAYLVRVRNACGATAGTSSGGVPRTAGPCP